MVTQCKKNEGKPHDCRLNHTGSAKSMEASMAVELINNNKLLKEANVRIAVVIGDDDSSFLASIRVDGCGDVIKW